MDIEHGNLGYNIFGGGWGNIVEDEDLSADKRVTSADVTGNAHIFVNGGNALMTSYWLPDERTWVPASVKGTKIYSPQYDHEARKFKINHNIYGGGNLASTVGGNTYITITHGFLKSSTQMVGMIIPLSSRQTNGRRYIIRWDHLTSLSSAEDMVRILSSKETPMSICRWRDT